MSELEKEEIITRISSMTEEQMRLALQVIPLDYLIDEVNFQVAEWTNTLNTIKTLKVRV